MKKMLSIILSLVMAMYILVVPASVSAKQTKKKPNTYVATWSEVLNFSKGTITADYWGAFAYYKNSGKNYIILDDYNTPYGGEGILGYYVRGDKVYYCIKKERDLDYTYEIKTVDLNGKNQKVFYKTNTSKVSTLFLLGGYGSGAIFSELKRNRKTGINLYTVKIFRNNKLTTLFKVNSKKAIDFNVFNGKIYYQNKAYNLDNGKKTTFTAKEIFVTNKYMYYINKNNNLKSLDKNGVRRIVTKNVYRYYYGNNGSSVIYSKLNSNKEEVFYKRTINQKEYKLCSWKDIIKASKFTEKSKHSGQLFTALFYNNKVYFNTGATVLNVNLTGGTPKLILKAEDDYMTDMYLFGKKIVYKEFNPMDYIVDD